jgi:RNA polymerase sigma factor (TIGR02999 family)
VAEQDDVETLLAAVRRGEAGATDRLIGVIYPELRRLAHAKLARERPGHFLNTTAIVHEAYLKLAAAGSPWNDRQHFMRAAGAVMRHLLVDYARQRDSDKRGGGAAAVTLGDADCATEDDSLAVIALDDAMKSLAEIDPRLEQIMECRYFAGLSVPETAEALGMSVRSVEREWRRAKGYLLRALESDDQ